MYRLVHIKSIKVYLKVISFRKRERERERHEQKEKRKRQREERKPKS